MESFGGIGKMVMIVGGAMLLIGAILTLVERGASGPLSWLGRLPGDIMIKRDHVTVYVPLVTSVLISIVLSLLAWVLFRR